MGEALQTLIVEDSESDTLLLLRELEKAGFAPQHGRVETKEQLSAALAGQSWDIILSDFCLPNFDAPRALGVLQSTGIDIPFIVISGTVGEDIAVQTMKAGAHDYLLKGSLTRLGEAIRREIRDAGIRREHRADLKKLEHLSRVLRGIRNVNQLIVREKDPGLLLRQSCSELVDSRGYRAAWAVVTEPSVPSSWIAVEQGFGDSFGEMRRQLVAGFVPACCEKVLASHGPLTVAEPTQECPIECPMMREKDAGCRRAGTTMISPLESNGENYGFVLVVVPEDLEADDEETGLLSEVASDVAFALHSNKLELKRREAEEALHRSEAQLSNALQMAQAGHWEYDVDRDMFTFNDNFYRIFRTTAAQVGGYEMASAEYARRFCHPDDVALVGEEVRAAIGTTDPDYSRQIEHRILYADGEVGHIAMRFSIVKDSQGRTVRANGVNQDITERKRYEAQSAQSDRLASMGMLAAGVAHEINNPLAYVLYNLESLTDDLPRLSSALRRCLGQLGDRVGHDEWTKLSGADHELLNPSMLDDIQARFKDALQGTYRIRDIARGLGTFSRVEQDRLVPVNLMHVIEVAIDMVFNEIKYRARLVKEYGKVSAVTVNDGKLCQVFLNLLINAVHAIPEGNYEGNEIRVRTWQEGNEVLAEVRDTGGGIQPEHLPRLFEPFFTTKKLGVGTGLGLSISKNIVESYGGRIEVRSTVGEGTSFVIRLPVRARVTASWRAALQYEDAARDATVRGQPAARGRLLVVDDEPGIRSVMAKMLRGNDVVEAASGQEARSILEADQAFDLILCDMMMPTMSGIDLHEWLLSAHPALANQVVFITGGAFTPKARDYLGKVSNIRLEKPFDVANFKKIVAELIRASRAQG